MSQNIEWIFSGIGVAVLGFAGRFIYRLVRTASGPSAEFVNQRKIMETLPAPTEAVPYMFFLPDGTTVDPMKVTGIKISGLHRGGNMCVSYRMGNAEIGCFYTYSKR